MQISDIGAYAVLWLDATNSKITSAWAFFHTKEAAQAFCNSRGGELYLRHQDGALKRIQPS